MRKILEPILFLISFFNLLGLLVMIPVAMFAPARVAKPWSVVSLLTLVALVCPIGWRLLGLGC